jgi:hypothetical protein
MTFLYPTASTTAVFINGYHVEQAYQLQYKESVSKIPIYGYSDYTYSKIALGKTLVQGILVLNFISPGYLSAVLETLPKDYTSPPKKLRNYGFSKAGSQLLANKEVEDIKNELRTELPQMDAPKERAEYIASILQSKPGFSDTKLNIKDAIWSLFTKEDKFGLDNVLGNSAVRKEQPSSISITQNQDLVLDIYYQDPKYALWWVRFKKVHFYETSQTISQAGAEGSSDPLYEIYPWIASEKIIHMVQ